MDCRLRTSVSLMHNTLLIVFCFRRKKQNFVNFDLQGVDMSRFALEGFDNKFSKFNLYAVGDH